MAGRECYHCKQWVEEGEEHDCWTTTEAALTQDLSEDLQDAWERLRETAVSFGDQRIYASHKSIMFSRKSCYFFVRPKRNFLEVCVFLGRALKAPQVRRVDRASKSQGRSRHSDQAPGRGGGAHHRLASGSLRTVRYAGRKRRLNPRQLDTETQIEAKDNEAPSERRRRQEVKAAVKTKAAWLPRPSLPFCSELVLFAILGGVHPELFPDPVFNRNCE